MFDIYFKILYIQSMKEITRIEIQKILEKYKEYLGSRFHVINVGLFGSFVTGENSSSSDIDILVEFKKGHKDFFNYMRLKHFLEEAFGREVDLVMKGAVKPQLRERIFRQVHYV